MATKASVISTFNTSGFPPKWNWEADRQPEDLKSSKDYIVLAEQLTKPSLRFAADMLFRAGYIKENDIEKTANKLARLGYDEKLYLDGVSVSWRVKTHRSIEDKILKDKKMPDDIGDYFGLKFVGQSVDDIEALREAVLNSRNMTSRKCEFTKPSDAGYRSHKSHHRIEHKDRKLSIEALITHAEFETIDPTTHAYMEVGRDYRRQLSALPKDNFNEAAMIEYQIKDTKRRRIELNNSIAEAAGLNRLCDANDIPVPERACPNTAAEYLRQIAPAFVSPQPESANSNTLSRNFG